MRTSLVGVEKCRLLLANGVIIDVSDLRAKLSAYLELQDRVIVKVWTAVDATKEQVGYNLCRNLFCYSKADGSIIWQVEQAYHPNTREPLDEVFKYIGLSIAGSDGKWMSLGENGSEVVKSKLADGSEVVGQVYLKPFRYGIDKLNTMTWSRFPQEYWVDYETGKLEWFAYHQKI